MCYYHPGIDVRQKPVALEALTAAIAAAHEVLGLQNLVFAGKEPLLGVDRMVELIRFAGSLPEREFAIGLVTNGRGMLRHWERLDPIANGLLDFVDLSLDSGFPEQHDAIRGRAGTFALAFDALKRCSSEWHQVRVGATSVLRQDNTAGILELVRKALPHTHKFFVTPIQPPPFSDTAPLSWNYIRSFLDTLERHLSTEWRGAGIEFLFSMLGIYAWDAEADGLIGWDELQEDGQGQVFVERDVAGNTLQLHLQVLPETAVRVLRIDHTGACLPSTAFLQSPRPGRWAVGNVADEALPLLYERSLADNGVLARMYASRQEHACHGRPCWDACFGGLAAAERNLVSGLALTRQPTLCLKTEADFANGRGKACDV